jgi:hypothetical protein
VSDLTADRLRELLDYNPSTGTFTWRRPVARRVHAGDVAGAVNGGGYLQIIIDYLPYQAHRLAWLWVNGEWPKAQIDHINMDRVDNRVINLREATVSQNHVNRRPYANNKCGWKGVNWNKSARKWRATTRVSGSPLHLGSFDRCEHASYIYHVAAVWYHGEFARVNDAYREALEPGKLVILDKIREKFAELHEQVAVLADQVERLARDVAPWVETRKMFERRVLTNLTNQVTLK